MNVVLLDLHARADGFAFDDGVDRVALALEQADIRVHRVRAVGVVQGDPRLLAVLRATREPVVAVLLRAWTRALVDGVRAALPAGSKAVRLTSDGTPGALDDAFDHVLDMPGLLALVSGRALPNVSFHAAPMREVRARAQLPVVRAEPRGEKTEVGDRPRPTIAGPSSGCPYMKDARVDPRFAAIAQEAGVQFKGCTFCLDQTGVYAAATEETVLASWLGQLRQLRADDPALREVLLVDERPHPVLPALFTAIAEDPALHGIELLFKSRVDWLLEMGPTHLATAASIASASGSALHLYLVGFESFDDEHLALFNKGHHATDNVRAIELARDLEARFPTSFVFSRLRAHGFVLFTPWTTPESLLTNARAIKATRFHELRADLLRTRLRLYPRTPLHALAAQEGLLVDNWTSGRPDRSVEQGYDASMAWRFRDPRTEAVFHIASAFAPRTRRRDDEVLAIAARLVRERPELAAIPELGHLILTSALGQWREIEVDDGALFDFENEAIFAGDKRAALKEDVPSADVPGFLRAYRTLGLAAQEVSRHTNDEVTGVHGPGEAHAVIAVARDDATLNELVAAQTAQRSSDARDATAAVGEMMGYPRCCVAAFLDQLEQGDNFDNERQSFLRRPEAPLDPLLNRLAPVRLIHHHICTPDCASSRSIAQANLERLRVASPGTADRLETLLHHAVLFVGYDRFVLLEGAWAARGSPDEHFRVDRVIPHRGEWSEPVDGLLSIRIRHDRVRFGFADGSSRDLPADGPLLVVPGEPLASSAIAAIRTGDRDRPMVRGARLPSVFRVGVRVHEYRIGEVSSDRSGYALVLQRRRIAPPDREDFRIRVRPFAERVDERASAFRAGHFYIDAGAVDQLSLAQRTALGVVVRVLVNAAASRELPAR